MSIAADVLQLRGLADLMDAEAFLPLKSEEMTADTGRRVIQFCDLVDHAVERLRADGLADTTGSRAAGGRRGSYTRYFRMHNAGCGLYYSSESWVLYGHPIWLQLKGSDWRPSAAVNDKLSPLGRESPPSLALTPDGAFVPIRLPLGVERDAVLTSVIRQMNRVADLVKDVPPATSAAVSPTGLSLPDES